MQRAYLTDNGHVGTRVRDMVIASGLTTLVVLVMAGLIAGSDREGLSALVLPDPLSHATELSADQPPPEDALRYLLDHTAEYVGL